MANVISSLSLVTDRELADLDRDLAQTMGAADHFMADTLATIAALIGMSPTSAEGSRPVSLAER